MSKKTSSDINRSLSGLSKASTTASSQSDLKSEKLAAQVTLEKKVESIVSLETLRKIIREANNWNSLDFAAYNAETAIEVRTYQAIEKVYKWTGLPEKNPYHKEMTDHLKVLFGKIHDSDWGNWNTQFARYNTNFEEAVGHLAKNVPHAANLVGDATHVVGIPALCLARILLSTILKVSWGTLADKDEPFYQRVLGQFAPAEFKIAGGLMKMHTHQNEQSNILMAGDTILAFAFANLIAPWAYPVAANVLPHLRTSFLRSMDWNASQALLNERGQMPAGASDPGLLTDCGSLLISAPFRKLVTDVMKMILPKKCLSICGGDDHAASSFLEGTEARVLRSELEACLCPDQVEPARTAAAGQRQKVISKLSRTKKNFFGSESVVGGSGTIAEFNRV